MRAIPVFLLACGSAFAGTITYKVGTTGACGGTCDYPTISAAFAAVPANLVTDGNSYVIDVYSTYTLNCGGATCFTFTARTTDSTHTLTIKAATGYGWRDTARSSSLPLAIDGAHGVAITKTDSTGLIFYVSGIIDYLTIDGFELAQTDTSINATKIAHFMIGCDHLVFSNNLMSVQTGALASAFYLEATSAKVLNNILIVRTNAAITGFRSGSGNSLFLGNGVVRPSTFTTTSAGVGFHQDYGSPQLKSSYVFGFDTANNGTWSAASSKNATSAAAIIGSCAGCTSLVFADQFNVVTDASQDFRVKSTSTLVGAGLLDSTNAPNDITGVARPASPTIGPWEEAPYTPPAVTIKRRILQ